MADERPVPDRPGAAEAGGTSGDHGMTWVALVLLLVMLVVVGWRLLDFWDSRQPPSGVETQQATVVGFEELGPSRAGQRSTEYTSVVFDLPDGEQASALYELRRLGDVEKGDEITVYQQGGEWRTTGERAWGSTLAWAVGFVALLAMVVGWFRVRARAKRARRPR
ncbi:hypothetical protein NYO98_18530 [Nocardioides sp. STR2]|uniref:DUF3592 domain-containing protein n=1 Tax=Nocardioides pini TaxID=2975053 RepID=A0ABT4CH62_9ACTN|nr:hypothetical protein [Nocardioides pini]MCY4728283.1 hypothetical protein [Nocardioides pini]